VKPSLSSSASPAIRCPMRARASSVATSATFAPVRLARKKANSALYDAKPLWLKLNSSLSPSTSPNCSQYASKHEKYLP
jgi:hypothetical protein